MTTLKLNGRNLSELSWSWPAEPVCDPELVHATAQATRYEVIARLTGDRKLETIADKADVRSVIVEGIVAYQNEKRAFEIFSGRA
jgi:hypothetical protein